MRNHLEKNKVRYLMTHSLLSSWLHALKESPNEDATTESDPMAEFMQTLRREPTPTTNAMQFGIDFENLVTAILTGTQASAYSYETKDHVLVRKVLPVPENPWYEAAANIAGRIRGGTLQCKAYKEITVDGMTLLLHGRLDCLKAGIISDIKFTKSYDSGKYYDSTQHPMYFELVPEAMIFTYLASNGNGVWPETYRRDETRSIIPDIQNFFGWLEVMGLMDVYREKWAAK